MKKLVLTAALAASFASGAVNAEEISPGHDLSYHVAVTSDYRFRGLSKSDEHPALQGSITYAHKSGFYTRAWMSSLKENPTGADMEIDLYAGHKGALGGGFSYNAGVVTITFPDGSLLNTTEAYAGIGYGPVSITYIRSLTDFCGYADSKGSSYVTLDASFDLGAGFGLGLHAGHQDVSNWDGDHDYANYSVTLSKKLAGAEFSLMAVDNNKAGEDLGLVFTVSKAF